MKAITPEYIKACKDSEAGRLELCAAVAANLQENNPQYTYRYNEKGVYWMPGDARIVLIFSWTCFGEFILCQPALNITEYVRLDSLKALETEAVS